MLYFIIYLYNNFIYLQEQYEQHVLKFNESPEKKRARLLWQSRKRGIAENCLLFGTFSEKYLDT